VSCWIISIQGRRADYYSSNYSAKDTRRLGATIDVDQSTVRFLGSLVLVRQLSVSSPPQVVWSNEADTQNLWDCGGQNAFVDNYLTAQQSTIFANVAVLIYVFDITSTEWEADLKYFDEILVALREYSGDAGVWVLINKMDLADKEDPARKKYEERKADILGIEERIRKERREKSGKNDEEGGSIRCFATSIWDESLYKVKSLSQGSRVEKLMR
jgi:Ras-related GTP-binding protein A/B